MGDRAHILVMGYNAWDVSLSVSEPAGRDQKQEVAGISMGGGGPAATAAIAMARLGAAVKLITVLGNDLAAEWQQNELAAAGVGCDDCPHEVGATPKAVIMVHPDSGERCIYWSRGDLPLLDPALVQLSWLDDRQLFYTDGHEPQAAVLLAAEARRRQRPVVMDAGSVRPGSAELVAEVTDAISSQEFAPRLTGCREPGAALRALRERGPSHVAMTFGVGGALALIGETLHHVPAFDISVVDTTGAGDAFHAGYALARAEGQGFLASLEYGSAVAALKCTGWGGRSGLPEPGQVLELIRTGTRVQIPAELASFVD